MAPQTEIQRYVRFEITGRVAYGWWRDGAIEELKGSIYGAATPTGRTFRSEQVRLLVPCEPSKVVAVGLNYASHQQFVTIKAIFDADEILAKDRVVRDGWGKLKDNQWTLLWSEQLGQQLWDEEIPPIANW